MATEHRTALSDTDAARYQQYYRDEVQAALLYRSLADVDAELRADLLRLASAEDRHARHWRRLLTEGGHDVPVVDAPELRTRLLCRIARRFGSAMVLPLIVRAEAADAAKYRSVPHAPRAMVAEEMTHGRRLAELAGVSTPGGQIASSEGRHRVGVGGALRAAVFGVNDGLVSNLALVMGVAGGTTDSAVVVLAGVAGLFAGSFSMGTGEWISVRSQTELFQSELEVEREELRLFPHEEQDELELIYRAKGLDAVEARQIAGDVIADPSTALETLAREELGIDPDSLGPASAWTAALSSFVAFGFGATIPLLPFVLGLGSLALVASATLSGLALAAIGAVLGVFTNRSALRSALRMAAVGAMAATATYLIGTMFGVVLD